MYWFFKIILFIPVKLFFPTKIIGKNNINKKDKTILICNHQSIFDVIILLITYPKKIYFLGKKELFSNKFKSWLFRSLGVIPIDRGNVQINSIKQVLKLLKENKTIGIFPEGTRNKNENTEGELQEIKNGVIMFSVKSCSSIQPTMIQRKPKFFRKNKITFGERFNFNNVNNKKDYELMSNIIIKEMNAIRQK